MSTLPFLTCIQQAGIGVADLDVSWKWYRRVFNMRVPVFDDAGTAELMTRYTNGIPERRRAQPVPVQVRRGVAPRVRARRVPLLALPRRRRRVVRERFDGGRAIDAAKVAAESRAVAV